MARERGDGALSDDAAPERTEPTPRPPRPPRRPPPWSVVVLALLLAVLGVAAAVAATLLAPDGPDAADDGRAAALTAARERTTALTTYDFTTLEEDFAGVLATSTGPFKAEYEETSASLRETFTSTQAVAAGAVLGAGLEGYAPRRAVAVVAVDQVIRTAGAAPRRERNRLRMVLVRPDQTWLVERVQRL